MRPLLTLCLVALAGLAATGAKAAGERPAFTLAAPITAPDGRWDFASWDSEHQRVLVAHGSDVLIVDPAGPVRAIGAVAGAHQVLALTGNRVLVTSGHDDTVRILDASSGAQLASIAVAGDPDAAILSPDGHTAYVMAAKAGAVSVIDLDRQTESVRIAVKPALEVPAWVGEHILAINDEDAGEIELVDTAAGRQTGSIALPGCEGPTGLAYAPGPQLALSACANGKAAIVDMRARKLTALLPIGMGPDTAIWDAAHGRFLVPCGKSGTLSVIAPGDGRAQVVTTVDTQQSARTAALDPASGRLYLPAAKFAPAEPGKRPGIAAGSFHIVVLVPTR